MLDQQLQGLPNAVKVTKTQMSILKDLPRCIVLILVFV